MYPKIYNSSGELLAVLSNIITDTASIKRVVNGEFTFTFQAYEEELKSEFFNVGNVIMIDGQYFDIKYYEHRHNQGVTYQIQCEHVNYRLEDGEENTYEMYTNTGTPAFILADILSGTDFSVGVVDFTEAITITSGESEVTKKNLIYELVNLLGGEIEYTNGGFTINMLNTIGKDNGFQVRFGRNLLGITKFVDNRGEFIVSYEVDIVELKNSNEYKEQQLQDLDVIEVGDTIRIVDEVIGLDIVNRIVSREYNPINTINTKLEIANKIETIIDTLISIQTTTVKTDKLYNNVSISNMYGFKAERSDKKAKIEMNATEGLSVFTRSDPESPYSKNLLIDSDGNIVMSAQINLIANSDVSILGLKALAYSGEWGDLLHIPNTLKAPAGSGLFVSPTHMGFHHKDHGWRTYMDGDGRFFLGGVGGKLQWNPTTNQLRIEGSSVVDGQIKGGTIEIGSGNSIFKATSEGVYIGDSTFSNAPFKVGLDGSVTMSKLTAIDTASVNGGYIHMEGTKIEGKITGTPGDSYIIGTAALNTGWRAGVFQSRGYKNSSDTNPAYVMSVASNAIMVSGGNLMIGGSGEDRVTVIGRRALSAYLDLNPASYTETLRVVGDLNVTGVIKINGTPLLEYLNNML